MTEAKWLEEKEFEEIAAEATQRMKNQAERVVCVKDSNYCTSCGRCQNEEEGV